MGQIMLDVGATRIFRASQGGCDFADPEIKNCVKQLYRSIANRAGIVSKLFVSAYRIQTEILSIEIECSNHQDFVLTAWITGRTVIPTDIEMHADSLEFTDWVDAFYFMAGLHEHFDLLLASNSRHDFTDGLCFSFMKSSNYFGAR